MKLIPFVIIAILLAGAFTSSCRHYPTTPPTDSTKCDTCCDTCHTDTTQHPINVDSTSHDFEWTEYSIPGESSLTGVWVFNDTNILIVGNALWYFNGATFTDVKPIRNGSNTPLSGVLNGFNIFALNQFEYWMAHGSISFHTINGRDFDDIRPGNSNACWGSSSNDIFVVGNSGQIHHWDGTKFTDMVSSTTKSIGTISGTSNKNIWAAGWNSSTGESVILHYDGTSWSEDPFSISGLARDWGIGSAWTTDSANHQITIIAGSTVFRKTDNGVWRSDSDHVGNKLNGSGYIGIAVTGNSINDFIAVGGWGFVSHWDGRTWKKYNELFDYGNLNFGALAIGMKKNTICIVGTKSGQSWIAVGRRK